MGHSMAEYKKLSSVHQQTNDPTKFPTSSNNDSSIGLGLLNDKNMDPLGRKTVSAPGQDNASESPDIQLESTDRRKLKPKAANYQIKYSEATQTFYVQDISKKQSSTLVRRNSFNLLNRFGHTFNLFEKEIIVWVRLNSHNKDTVTLISDIMYLFNISENKSNFLLDSAGV